MTTQENFWCVLKCLSKPLFTGSMVDKKWKIGLMDFDGDLNEIDGFAEIFLEKSRNIPSQKTCDSGILGQKLGYDRSPETRV